MGDYVHRYETSPKGKATRKRYYQRTRARRIAQASQWYYAHREHVLRRQKMRQLESAMAGVI